jgi:hypothetical protein
VGPLRGAGAGDPGASTINAKKHRRRAPLGDAEAGDPEALTINAKKHRRRAPWEMPELVIRERPPLTLKNVDGGALGGAGTEDSEASTINVKKR